ncbi:hypothetical protein YC2023_041184 [Brassica napus]
MQKDNKRSNQWKGGTSCKKGRLRKLSRVWLKMGKAWKKNMEPGYLNDKISLKMIKEVAQQVVRGECSYSAYMSNSVEDSMVMKEQEIKGADDPITKKEWDEFVKYVYALATTRRQVLK